MQLNSELRKHVIRLQIFKHFVYKRNMYMDIYTYILGSYKLDVNHIVEFPD